MLARSFLSLKTFSIQVSSAFSSSGTKKEDSKDSTLSKFADADVMCSEQMESRTRVSTDSRLQFKLILASIHPYDRYCDDNEDIVPL